MNLLRRGRSPFSLYRSKQVIRESEATNVLAYDMKKRWSSPLVLFLLLTTSTLATGTAITTTTTETPTYPYFEDPTVETFNHMTVHDYTERIYIGAVNRIYQLSRDLKQEDVATMGPKDDNPKSPVTKVCLDELKRPTDYYNKALLVDYSQSKLIVCGSLFQGTCTVHDLNQVSNYETPASESVVANTATASTVAFIAPGPKNLPRTHVLYVGVSYTGNGPFSSDVPAVSSRSLDPSNTFVIAHSGVTTGTKISLNSMFREIYPITYVYGFSSKGFSYFVTVQKMSTDLPRPFISKLVRVCQRDVQYYSYTEVPLVCRTSPDGIDYNLVQAAYVGKPGSELAKSLGISAQESVLFAVFAKSKDEADIYNKPSPNSALCVYALSAVHRKFTQNIQHCFNGNGERGLDFINPSQPCYPTQLHISDDFCGMDVNTPMEGSMLVEAAPVLRFPGVLLTAVAAASSHDYTVTFLGTSQGHLKKLMIDKQHLIADEGNLNQSGRLILCLGEMANTVCCTDMDPTIEAHVRSKGTTGTSGFCVADD
ncbi:Plexin A3 [Araneus ventricosus]|uniref:Plexin A3 n=1 Tax=Araneus ventricosus TaxID=182803 RepID=A0A4Y2RG31_ARAVE|nr:Plexin A3 [Araneus ventricosus]